MNKTELMNMLTRKIHKVGFELKKHSPEILVTAGVVGTVATTVMACKATTKAGDILDEFNSNMDDINKVVEMGKEEYTEDVMKKDIAIVYVQTGVKFAKLYAPSVALGVLSITSILAGHNILRKRNVALAAAYATIDKSFKEYRGRVVERFGKELDNELRYNIKAKEFEEVQTDDKGKEKVVKNNVQISELEASDYAKFFDEGCNGWTKDPEANLLFLKKQQTYANNRLKANGYLFLNEVYEMLGIPRTKAGQVVGWIYDEKNPVGDNYVDFGIYDTNKNTKWANANKDFVNGYERSILLDFNVDGDILNNI